MTKLQNCMTKLHVIKSRHDVEFYCDHMVQREPGQEVVVLSQILASEISSGYDGIRNIVLESFNGNWYVTDM